MVPLLPLTAPPAAQPAARHTLPEQNDQLPCYPPTPPTTKKHTHTQRHARARTPVRPQATPTGRPLGLTHGPAKFISAGQCGRSVYDSTYRISDDGPKSFQPVLNLFSDTPDFEPDICFEPWPGRNLASSCCKAVPKSSRRAIAFRTAWSLQWRRTDYPASKAGRAHRLEANAHVAVTAAMVGAPLQGVRVGQLHQMNHLRPDPQPPPCHTICRPLRSHLCRHMLTVSLYTTRLPTCVPFNTD